MIDDDHGFMKDARKREKLLEAALGCPPSRHGEFAHQRPMPTPTPNLSDLTGLPHSE